MHRGPDAKDGLYYKSQTTLAGIVQKHTGEGDFNAPQVQLDAIGALRSARKTPYMDASLGDVPVNFLSTVDTTGGNSGSPTLNGRGELVRSGNHALDSCGQPVHALEHGRGGRRRQPTAGDVDSRAGAGNLRAFPGTAQSCRHSARKVTPLRTSSLTRRIGRLAGLARWFRA